MLSSDSQQRPLGDRPSARDGRQRAPRRMTPERRRDHLVTTALWLYGHRPPADVTIEDVVRAADISRPLFYRYFTNLRELHVAALRSVVDKLIARLDNAGSGTFAERLHALLGELIDFAGACSDSYLALLRSGSAITTSDTGALVDRVREHVLTVACARAGLAEPPPALVLTVRGWVSLVEVTLVSWLRESDISRGWIESWLVEQLFTMLRTTAARDATSAQRLADVLGS